ncbi:hypothetical protein B484DRAFT_202676, partial [Ochromonadaceae sp. CCMP2298]
KIRRLFSRRRGEEVRSSGREESSRGCCKHCNTIQTHHIKKRQIEEHLLLGRMSQSPHFAIAEAAEREEARAREENEAVRVASSSSREEDVEVDVGDTTAAAAAEGTLVVEEGNFPSSTTMVVFDFKRNNKSWQIYLGGIATRRDYEHRVDDFCVYHKPPNALPDSLIDYFYERQQETKVVKKVEKCRYAATTMISW